MLSFTEQLGALRYFSPLFVRTETDSRNPLTRIQKIFNLNDSPCVYPQMSAIGVMEAFNHCEHLNHRHFRIWCVLFSWYGKNKGLSAIAEENGFFECEVIKLVADMRFSFAKLDKTCYPTDILLECLKGWS